MRRNGWERVTPACERQLWSLLSLFLTLSAALLILLLQYTGDAPWWQPLEGAGPLLAVSLLILRYHRSGIYTSRGRVRIRTTARTHTLAWGEVTAIVSAPRDDTIRLQLRDGRSIPSTVRGRRPGEGRKSAESAYSHEDMNRFRAILQDRLLQSRKAEQQPGQAS